MSTDRIDKILEALYTRYRDIKEHIYYSEVKSVYYLDKLIVYDIQKKMEIEANSNGDEDLPRPHLLKYNSVDKVWYYEFYQTRKKMHCFSSWRAFVGKHFIGINPWKKFDPYLRFRPPSLLSEVSFSKEEKIEIAHFIKNKKNI